MAGIERITKTLVTLAKIAEGVEDALADDKISAGEGLKIAFDALGLISVVKNLKEIKEELFALTEEDIVTISVAFQQDFDLDNDAAEEIVETILELALNVIVATDLFKKE